MAKRQPFALIYDPEVVRHLDAIEPKYHSLIRTTIEKQLRFKPESRNRKQLERPIDLGARWELRLGPDNRFRVFYRVDAEQAGSHSGHRRERAESDISRRRRGGVMKIASVAEVKARLSAYLEASATGPVVVTRNGKPVAVLLGVSDDEDLERLLLAHSRKLRAILDAADRRIDQGAGIAHDEFWQKVESAHRPREGNESGRKRRTKR